MGILSLWFPLLCFSHLPDPFWQRHGELCQSVEAAPPTPASGPWALLMAKFQREKGGAVVQFVNKLWQLKGGGGYSHWLTENLRVSLHKLCHFILARFSSPSSIPFQTKTQDFFGSSGSCNVGIDDAARQSAWLFSCICIYTFIKHKEYMVWHLWVC